MKVVILNALHWFLCGFEGAVLVRNADLFPKMALPQRQQITDLWFSTMFARFGGHGRIKFESRFNDDAEKLRDRLLQSAGRLSFQDLLVQLCDFIALSSAEKSQNYYKFWHAMINTANLELKPANALAADLGV